MFKLDLEKAEEPEIKLPTSVGSSKKQKKKKKVILTIPGVFLIKVSLCSLVISNCKVNQIL